MDIEKVIELCVHLDVCYHARGQEKSQTCMLPRPLYWLAPNFQTPPDSRPETVVESMTPAEPMGIRHLHLTETEKQMRRSLDLCLDRGLKRHTVCCPLAKTGQ